jgi:hypothetical protein
MFFLNAQENQDTNPLRGHYIGIKSGALFSNEFSNCSYGEYNQYKPKMGIGFHGGFTYYYVFQNNLTLSADLIYSIKRYHPTGAIFYSGDTVPDLDLWNSLKFNSTIQEHYLEIPLKIGYITGKKFNFFINGGLVPGIDIFYKSASTITYPSGEVSKKGSQGIVNYSRISLEAILETGIGYTFDKFFAYVSIDGKCSIFPIHRGFIFWDICQDRFYSFGFNIGLRYRLTPYK